MATQVEIARKLGLDVSSVNKILNQCKGPVFKKETIDKVFQTAEQMGYDFSRIKFRHRRRYPRRPVKLDAVLSVVQRDGSIFDTGKATIEDISSGGVRIANVNLPQGCLPLNPFTVSIQPTKKNLQTLELPGRIVRWSTPESSSFGISFERLSADQRKKVDRITTN